MLAKSCRRRWSRKFISRTKGVPLLVEEFSRLACESAMFEPARVASAPGTKSSTGELPATLQELVMARLDRMSADHEVAQLAATLGREFDYDLLAAVVTVDEQTLRAELAKLVSAGIIYAIGQPPECVYLFKHVLIEEALSQCDRRAKAPAISSAGRRNDGGAIRELWSRPSRSCSRSIFRKPG